MGILYRWDILRAVVLSGRNFLCDIFFLGNVDANLGPVFTKCVQVYLRYVIFSFHLYTYDLLYDCLNRSAIICVRNYFWLIAPFPVFQELAQVYSLQWRHIEHNGVSNHQPHDCLLNRVFRRRSKKTSQLRVTGLWEDSSVTILRKKKQ